MWASFVNHFLEAIDHRHFAQARKQQLDPGLVSFLLVFCIDSFFFMNSLTLRMDTNSSVQETYYTFSSGLPWELKQNYRRTTLQGRLWVNLPSSYSLLLCDHDLRVIPKQGHNLSVNSH